MAKLEPMDILQAPTENDKIVAQIVKWIKTSHDDKENKVSTVVFKKNTPKKISKLFERSTDLFTIITDFTINKHYEIEK